MAIARDASSPATFNVSTAGAGGDDPTGTSASFTPPLGAVITVAFAVDTNSGTTPTSTCSNSGFVVNSGGGWTQKELRGDAEGSGGYVVVFTGVVTASAAGTVTVQANNTGVPRISQVYGSAYVDVWTGADTNQTGAADNEGSFTTNTFTSTALTTTRAGSQVVVIYGDWNASGTPTTGQQGTGFTGSFYSGIRTYQTNPVASAGNVAGAFDGPGTGAVDVNWVAVEVLAPSGGGGGTSILRQMMNYHGG